MCCFINFPLWVCVFRRKDSFFIVGKWKRNWFLSGFWCDCCLVFFMMAMMSTLLRVFFWSDMESSRYSVTTTASSTTSSSSTITTYNNKKNMSLYIGREASKVVFLLIISTFLMFTIYHFFILVWFVFIECINVCICSYGREFVQRQPQKLTSLWRIGSTFSLV